jgi:hypothetical protein
VIQAGIKEVIYEKSTLNSVKNGVKNASTNPDTLEAITRLVMMAKPL